MFSKTYLIFIAIKAWFSVRRRSKKEAENILTEIFTNYKRGNREDSMLIFWRDLIIPNFRLGVTIKLGKPSSSIYKKFSHLLDKSIDMENFLVPKNNFPRYLIIRDGAMGDVLMVTPVIRHLFKAHSGKIIIHIATHYSSVFNNSPYVSKVLNPKLISKGIHNYDVVVNLNGVYEQSPRLHPVNIYNKFVLGDGVFDGQLDLFPSLKDHRYIDDVVKLIGEPYVVIHQLHHEWPNRNISQDIWDKVVANIVKKIGLRIVYIGSGRGVFAKNDKFCEDHRDRYSVQQLSLLISRSVGFIGADSGPAHIAATTEAPVCVFYTCASHEVRMPLRVRGKFLPITPEIECYGCLANSRLGSSTYSCRRGDNACTTEKYLGDVASKVVPFLMNI